MATESDVKAVEDLASDIALSIKETIAKINNAKNIDEINAATHALSSKTPSWRNRIPREYR